MQPQPVASSQTDVRPADPLAELDKRLDFIGLDEEGLASLRAIQTHVDRHLPIALEKFYDRIGTVPEVSRFFADSAQTGRAQSSQVGHWKAIATGKFDADYSRPPQGRPAPCPHRARAALVYRRLRDDPRGADRRRAGRPDGREMAPTKNGLFGSSKPAEIDVPAIARALTAVVKAVLIDVDMAVTVYFDKLTEEAAERDRIAQSQLSRTVCLTGEALKRLAEGDLTTRITEPFEPEFAKIKDDTNAVAEQLTEIVASCSTTSRVAQDRDGRNPLRRQRSVRTHHQAGRDDRGNLGGDGAAGHHGAAECQARRGRQRQWPQSRRPRPPKRAAR